jgi:pyridinium-3,5-bisthiocarboxylic acid mononucleotide nickel chelatase
VCSEVSLGPDEVKSQDNRVVTIDAIPAGVSGDKYLGALIDLGGKAASLERVGRTIAFSLPGTKKVEVEVRRVERGSVGARLVRVTSEEEVEQRKGGLVRRAAAKCIEKLGLLEWGRGFVLSTIDTLLEAESRVHAHSSEDVELHELGSADTLVDIIGVALLAQELDLAGARWLSTPVAVGGGVARFSGSTYPNPAPATAEILRSHSFPFERGTGDHELSTPTGVALTVNLVGKYRLPGQLRAEAIGYGAGSREFHDVANVLRLIVGKDESPSHGHDEVVILETNLDDVSGEVIGRAVERLMASGARDVTITPVFMKKNRPGQIVSVIALKSEAEKLAGLLIEETGTLGVRELRVARHISNRTATRIDLRINGRIYSTGVKLSKDQTGKTIRAKLEYEDLRKISDQTGVSLRNLQKLARPQLDPVYKQAKQ